MSNSKGKIIAWIETPIEGYKLRGILTDSYGYIVDIEDEVLVIREENETR